MVRETGGNLDRRHLSIPEVVSMEQGPIRILGICGFIVLGALQAGCASDADRVAIPPPAMTAAPPAPLPQPSSDELEQLVAPIALYPDELVAQILAAATYPTQIVEADRWLQQHADLTGDTLATAVDAQPWDDSVKALTQFSGLLGMMDKNLSWTSSLGESYLSAHQNVLEAIQTMRQRAQRAGNLASTPQESVTSDTGMIEIEPADPDLIYVPEYDPWIVYGDPLALYPGWIGVPGFFLDGPGMDFGLGIGIGLFGGFGWGWHSWGMDWHRHGLTYGGHDHPHPYISHSREFADHSGAGGGHASLGLYGHGSAASGIRTSAFAGFNHGGDVGAFSSRGRASMGGGYHAGGGFHGGGFHGGGGGHR
jgi:hypothetical protein